MTALAIILTPKNREWCEETSIKIRTILFRISDFQFPLAQAAESRDLVVPDEKLPESIWIPANKRRHCATIRPRGSRSWESIAYGSVIRRAIGPAEERPCARHHRFSIVANGQ